MGVGRAGAAAGLEEGRSGVGGYWGGISVPRGRGRITKANQ